MRFDFLLWGVEEGGNSQNRSISASPAIPGPVFGNFRHGPAAGWNKFDEANAF
jgi:hypothetical protein